MQRQLLLLLTCVCCVPTGRRWYGHGAVEVGEGATWSMPLHVVHCPHLLLAVQQQNNNNIVFVASVSFFSPVFLSRFSRFSAIQNYSRMKIKNMFSGKFNTRVDSASAGKRHCHSYSYSFIALTCSLTHSLTTLLFIYSQQQIAYKKLC